MKIKNLSIFFLLIFIIGCSEETEEVIPGLNYTDDMPQEEVLDVYVNETPQETEEEIPVEDAIDETRDEPNEKPPETGDSDILVSDETNKTSDKMIQSSRCQDSDANNEYPDGINLFLKGTVTINNKPIKGGVDFCTSVTQVSEWYCSNGVPRVTVYKCPDRCTEAVCIK